MSISEARIEETPAGRVPRGSGWFVLSLVGESVPKPMPWPT